jgi:hypothetical protein
MSVPGAHPSILTEDNVERLLSVLGEGRDAALTSWEIQRRLGFPRQRTSESVRALVQFAVNKHHHLILSGPKGFWMAGSREEVVDAIRGLEVRRVGLQRRIHSLEEAWRIRNDSELS